MYHLIDFCCICFNNKGHLQPLSDSDSNNITYFVKLTSCVSEMYFNEMNEHWLLCNKCCETMDEAFKFRQQCLRSKTTLTDYISHQYKFSNISDAVHVYLTDINKFCVMKQEFQIKNNLEKTDMIIKMNDYANKIENSDINRVTEIRRENSPYSSKLIGTEHNHIQFENVVIKMEREDQFFEENVEESFNNSVVNQDEIKNDNQDIEGRERFENILETCNDANDNMKIKLEENHYYSLQVEKHSNDPLPNLDEMKIDIVNEEINIKYKSENTKEFSTEDNFNPLKDQDEVKRDKEANVPHKPEGKQKTTSTGIHECSICQRKFTFLSNMREHMRRHSGEKPHECSVCQKKFTRSSYLREHARIHTGERPYECTICQKKFTLLATLISHKRIHTGEKQHECSICQKKFTRLDTLIRHKRIHPGEKSHECDVCQKKFGHTYTLTEHKKIHTGEKPPTCSVCQKIFTYSWNLKVHMKSHTGENMHECSVCQIKFSHQRSLSEHMKFHYNG